VGGRISAGSGPSVPTTGAARCALAHSSVIDFFAALHQNAATMSTTASKTTKTI